MDETEELKLVCPKKMIGRIIGPKGSMIKAIRAESGAKVDIVDPTEGTESVIKISGTRDEVAKAGKMCNAIISPPVNPYRSDHRCDKKVVGRLIGPRGATIKQIQADTGASINVDSDKTPCLVTITAEGASSLAHCQRLVLEIIDPKLVTVRCPKALVGRVIGPRGSVLRGIEADSGGARLDINSDRDPAIISISGSEEAMLRAKTIIERIVSPPSVTFTCPRRLISRLIGKSGSKIRELQEIYKVRIQVEQIDGLSPPPKGGHGDGMRRTSSVGGTPHGATVTVSEDGEGGELRDAVAAVKQIVEPLSVFLDCPESCISALLGDDGENIIQLRKECGDVAGSGIDIGIDLVENVVSGGFRVRIETCNRDVLAKVEALVREEIQQAMAEGDYTGAEGTALRGAANKAARERSILFEEASSAFENGDGERAKELSDQARRAGEAMREANKKAAGAIFSHRNSGEDGPLTIDLHGLTVAEALGFLRAKLSECLQDGAGNDQLTCITGAGNHSPGQLARIRPAVRQLCASHRPRLKCEDDDNPGTFLIHC